MSKKILQRESSLQNILEAAMELFSEQGYDCTSIRQIAAKAGISLGLLYNYFKSKEEVLKAGLEKGRQEMLKGLEMPKELTPIQELEHYVRLTVKRLEEHRNFWRLYYSLRLQSEVVKALEKELQPEHQKILAHLTKCLADAGSTSPTAEAKLMVASLDGISHHYLLYPDYPLADVTIRYLVQLKSHLNAS